MSNLQTVPTASKYGLVKKQGELSGPALAKQQQNRFGMSLGGRGGVRGGRARPPPRAVGPMGGVFRADDSDEDLDEDPGAGGQSRPDMRGGSRSTGEIGSVNRALLRAAAVTESKQAGLSAADIECFDYDGQYDSFKKSAGEALGGHALNQSNSATVAPKSRYISSLKCTAAVRDKEKDRIYERKLLRERQEEEKTLGLAEDEPKYITSAYKKKLMEEQKWDYEDKLNDEIERRNDVTTKKDGMGGFYAGLLTKNIAFGGDAATATSAYTAGSSRQAKYLAEGESAQVKAAVPEDVAPMAAESRKRVAENEADCPPPAPATPGRPPSEALEGETSAPAVSEEEQRLIEAQRKADAVAAAKARFLERKKQKPPKGQKEKRQQVAC